MPRAKTETITLISDHLRRTLDLLLFSGHKALLTSQMHLSSVRVSYRELEDKTQKLQEAFDRLRELDRLKSNFLGTVSHELRTPLTSIIGYSEMLAEGIAGPLGDEQREFVQTIREKGEQLLQLILGLLDLSKLESGTMSLRKANFKLAKVLDDVVSTITPRARKRGVLLRCEASESLPDLIGDAERLRQVFINLTDNAVKFSPDGATVELSASSVVADAPVDGDEGEGLVLLAPSRRALEVRVADHGIGIPEAERSRIFDPFYQVDSSSTREYGGTGLGLSIVKRLVEAHGGTVRASANEPRGSIFVVTLPLESSRTK
jgi:signal transduction histidine kinase